MNEIIDFTTGTPARGSDFFFRDHFIEDLWAILKKEHVLLMAPRRMGKTSVLFRMLDHPKADYTVVFLNVEALETPAEFCRSLIGAIHDQQPELARAFESSPGFLGGLFTRLEKVELGGFAVALRQAVPDWDSEWKRVVEQMLVAVRAIPSPVLFIIDELPDMVINMQEQPAGQLESFLHWFRSVRQNPLGDNVRWLVAGSVNLRGTLDRLGHLKLINDIHVESLPAFSDREIEEFVIQMFRLRGVEFDGDVVAEIQNLLGTPIPLFLQLLSQELFRFWRRTRKRLTRLDVVALFNQVIVGDVARDKLLHFRSRIRTHYPTSEKEPAYRLLDQLSVSEKPISRETLFQIYQDCESTLAQERKGAELRDAFYELMMMLQNDFYIEETAKERYDFTSRTLKLWWRKYYG